MLARQVLVRSAAAAPLRPFGAPRNMATLREIEMRLKSVRNIGKITKARSQHPLRRSRRRPLHLYCACADMAGLL